MMRIPTMKGSGRPGSFLQFHTVSGAALIPVAAALFFCLWLVVFYKENAVNPIFWEYGMDFLRSPCSG